MASLYNLKFTAEHALVLIQNIVYSCERGALSCEEAIAKCDDVLKRFIDQLEEERHD